MSNLDKYMKAVRKASQAQSTIDESNKDSNVILGYVTSLTESAIKVLSPIGDSIRRVTLPNNGNPKIGYGYELYAFEVTRDEQGNVISWELGDINKYTTKRELVAVLANGKVLADDGLQYSIFDSTNEIVSSKPSHAELIMSYIAPFTRGTVNLYTIDKVIYSADYDCNDYKYCENFTLIEDVLTSCIEHYNR